MAELQGNDAYVQAFLTCSTGGFYDEKGKAWTRSGVTIGPARYNSSSAANTKFPYAIYFGNGSMELKSALYVLGKDFTIDFWYYRADGHNSSQARNVFIRISGNSANYTDRYDPSYVNYKEPTYFEWLQTPNTHGLVVAGSRRNTVNIGYSSWTHLAWCYKYAGRCYYIFINGKSQGSYIVNDNKTHIQPAVYGKANVYIAMMRISVGICRWTNNFVPLMSWYLPPPIDTIAKYDTERRIWRVIDLSKIHYTTKRCIGQNIEDIPYDTERTVIQNIYDPTIRYINYGKFDKPITKNYTIRKITSGQSDIPILTNYTQRILGMFDDNVLFPTKRIILKGSTDKPLVTNYTKRIIYITKGSDNKPILENYTKRIIIYGNNENPILKNSTRRIIYFTKASGNKPLLNNSTKRNIAYTNTDNPILTNYTKRIIYITKNAGNKPLLENYTERIIEYGTIEYPPVKNATRRIIYITKSNDNSPTIQNLTERIIQFGNKDHFPIKNLTKRLLSHCFKDMKRDTVKLEIVNSNSEQFTEKINKPTIISDKATLRRILSYKKKTFGFVFNPNFY